MTDEHASSREDGPAAEAPDSSDEMPAAVVESTIVNDDSGTEVDDHQPEGTTTPKKGLRLPFGITEAQIRPLGLTVLGAMLLAGVLGWLITYSSINPSLESAQDTVAELRAEDDKQRRVLMATASERDRVVSNFRELEKRTREEEETLAAERVELETREAELQAREQAVQATEDAVAANQFGGGIQIIGQTVAAGQYRTGEILGMCYYAWKTDTSSSADIVDNNIVRSGTATVTLRDGEVFESSGCGTWSKIG